MALTGVGLMGQVSVPEWEFRVVFGRTKIDFDPDKELENRKNHNYSLESGVQQLERMVFPIGAPHRVLPAMVTSRKARFVTCIWASTTVAR